MGTNFTQTARNFITFHRHAVLSTLSARLDNFPFGSVVPYDINSSGQIFIFVSFIAEHYKNLSACGKACLTVTDPFGIHNPQSYARAALLLTFSALREDERQQAERSYSARFPNQIVPEIIPNFIFLKGTPVKVRWIGGPAEAGWVEGRDFCAAVPDPIAYEGLELISEMNRTNQPELQRLASRQGAPVDTGELVKLCEISAHGAMLCWRSQGSLKKFNIPFPPPVASREEARQALLQSLQPLCLAER